MCFTVNVNLVKEEMEQRFHATLNDPDAYRPSYYYHAFECPSMPVVTGHEPDLIQLFQWGLIPSWTASEEKANAIRFQTFNARAETITQKPSFRKPIRTHRCLVIASGFYEWQHRSDRKIPYFIYLKDQKMFSLAGIYDAWINNATGELNHTFSIITTQANPMMEVIHNSKKRMPVILDPLDESQWLDHTLPMSEVARLLQPYPDDRMAAHTIPPLISKKGVPKNTPELIRPYDYSDTRLF